MKCPILHIHSLEVFNFIENKKMIDLVKLILEGVDLIASILGFIALYAIAIALLDWRKLNKIKND